MSRPLLVDLFCGEGGASMGYHRAGFDVHGIDIADRSARYPFSFEQADALEWLAGADLSRVTLIHASPPCQAYSVATAFNGHESYPDLVAPTREALHATGLPWVIENVPGAPVRADLKLCGCQFGLPRLRRQRWFETSWQAFELIPTCHHPDGVVSVIGSGLPSHNRARGFTMADRRAAMGIDWMSETALGLAISPAYTEHIGRMFLEEHSRRHAA